MTNHFVLFFTGKSRFVMKMTMISSITVYKLTVVNERDDFVHSVSPTSVWINREPH